jgi:SnoaL-like domain
LALRAVTGETGPIDQELQRLLDEAAIHRRLVDYCRGIDRLDTELVASVYHADATDDHGSFKGLGVEFAGFATERLRDRYEMTMHSIGNTIIEFTGSDTAHVESHVCARHLRRDDSGPVLDTFGGRYIDRFERRAGEWKIADRIVVHEWDNIERITSAYAPGRFVEGTRGPDDPAYRRP